MGHTNICRLAFLIKLTAVRLQSVSQCITVDITGQAGSKMNSCLPLLGLENVSIGKSTSVPLLGRNCIGLSLLGREMNFTIVEIDMQN